MNNFLRGGRSPTELRDRPAIEHLALQGLRFRPFKGEADYDAIGELLAKSWEADHIEWTVTADDYRRKDEKPINQDPFQDRLIGEIDGKMVGFCEVHWDQMTKGPRLYRHLSHVVPELRHTGMRTALLRWSEARLSGDAHTLPDELA